MTRTVLVDGQEHRVDLASTEATWVEVDRGVYSVLWGGRVYEARVEEGVVVVSGIAHSVQVVDPRELSGAATGGGARGRVEVRAPMPGRVVRVLVAEGAAVESGQGVVVVEAMKMQNELASPRAGTVSAIRAAEGAAVSAGEVLVVVE
jgi:biotin carboxyl carrier protein